MKEIQRILKNLSVLSLARIVSMFFGFLYTVYTARYLGPASYGILAFALALNGIFGVIANFGLDPLTVREVARNKNLAGKYLANGIVLKLLFGCLTFLIVFVVVNLLGYPEITKKVVYLITIFTILGGINNLFYSIYQAFEKMEFISIGQILKSVLLLIFAIVGIKFNFDVIYFALIYLIVGFIELIYNIIVTLWKFLKPEIGVDFIFWRDILREAYPFALTTIFVSIYYWIDSVMLSYIKGDEVVGWYNAAYRLMLIFLIIPSIFNTVIYPVMSKESKSKENLNFLFGQYLKYMIILALPLGVGVVLFADLIIYLIYGVEYKPSIEALQILIWSAVFIYLSSPAARVFEIIGKQSLITKITALGAFFNVLLNLIFIPRFSLYGASFTTVLTEFLVLIILSWYITKECYSLTKYSSIFIKVCLSIIITTIVVVLLCNNPYLKILIFGIIYLICLIFTKVITQQELNLIRTLRIKR